MATMNRHDTERTGIRAWRAKPWLIDAVLVAIMVAVVLIAVLNSGGGSGGSGY
jgi:hypothetical protein